MEKDLIKKLPVINRARAYRLYSSSGKRFVDFFQDKGTAVLGHRMSGINLSIKQALDKGVFFPCNTRYDIRLKNAVAALAGKNVNFSVFSSYKSLFSELNNDFPPFFPEYIPASEESNSAAFWRPFSGDRLDKLLEDYSFVVPVIPFPETLSPVLLLSLKHSLPEGEGISPILLAPFIAVIYKLINSDYSQRLGEWEKEEDLSRKLWRRKGIYLIPVYDQGHHEKIFCSFLEKGFLLSSCYSIPSILPGEISKGEKDSFFRTVNKVSGEFL